MFTIYMCEYNGAFNCFDAPTIIEETKDYEETKKYLRECAETDSASKYWAMDGSGNRFVYVEQDDTMINLMSQ